jgi:hypothetical protein
LLVENDGNQIQMKTIIKVNKFYSID